MTKLENAQNRAAVYARSKVSKLSDFALEFKSWSNVAEICLWLLCAGAAMFFVAVSDYGTEATLLTKFYDALPRAGMALAPGVAVSAINFGARKLIRHITSKRYQQAYAEYMEPIYDATKVNNVLKHYKRGIDEIVKLAKARDAAKLNVVVKDMNALEEATSLTEPEEERVVAEIKKYGERVVTNCTDAEKKYIWNFFSGESR